MWRPGLGSGLRKAKQMLNNGHALAGFTGDPRFIQNAYSQRMFSKLRSSGGWFSRTILEARPKRDGLSAGKLLAQDLRGSEIKAAVQAAMAKK